MRLPVAISLVLTLDVALTACGLLPPPSPPGQTGVAARQRQPTFLPGAPKPGDIDYDETACGGDHGMIEEMDDDDRGRLRVGPPQMTICP
jgi:hypothetical protein